VAEPCAHALDVLDDVIFERAPSHHRARRARRVHVQRLLAATLGHQDVPVAAYENHRFSLCD
jgi:hypothetical protein